MRLSNSSTSILVIIALIGPIFLTGRAQAADAVQGVTLRLVDPEGNPVEGARVGRAADIDDDSAREGVVPIRPTDPPAITDAQGMVTLPFELEFGFLRKVLLYALHQERGLVGVRLVDEDEVDDLVQWQLAPATRVHGKVTSTALEARGERLERSQIYVVLYPYGHVMSYTSDELRYEFLLPPGRHMFQSWHAGTAWYKTDWSILDVVVEAGAPEKVVDIDLPPHPLMTGVGKPAPELREIAGWTHGEPVRLQDLRGKVVMLYFWGTWCPPCIPAMLNLVELHRQFADEGLEIIAMHTAHFDTIEELEEDLARIRAEHWDGQDLPFRVALDGGRFFAEVPEDVAKQTPYGATNAAYGISIWPTALLIDREGVLLGTFDFRDEGAAAELERVLADE